MMVREHRRSAPGAVGIVLMIGGLIMIIGAALTFLLLDLIWVGLTVSIIGFVVVIGAAVARERA